MRVVCPTVLARMVLATVGFELLGVKTNDVTSGWREKTSAEMFREANFTGFFGVTRNIRRIPREVGRYDVNNAASPRSIFLNVSLPLVTRYLYLNIYCIQSPQVVLHDIQVLACESHRLKTVFNCF